MSAAGRLALPRLTYASATAWFALAAALSLILADIAITALSPWAEIGRLLSGVIRPDFLAVEGMSLVWTVAFAVLGVSLGAGAGFLMALVFDRLLPLRLACAFLRSVHELFWALLLMQVWGLSPLTGILAIAIPYAGSLILRHSLSAPMEGLETVPREQWPPVPVVFWSFRIMVGLGLLMLALGAYALFAWYRGDLFERRNLHRFAVLMGPAGFVAVIAGWVTTEVGRQPFTVYGLLRTAESVSPLDAPVVATSLLGFIVVYFTVFSVGAWYILVLMSRTPVTTEEELDEGTAPIRSAGITPASAVDPSRTLGSAKGVR